MVDGDGYVFCSSCSCSCEAEPIPVIDVASGLAVISTVLRELAGWWTRTVLRSPEAATRKRKRSSDASR